MIQRIKTLSRTQISRR